MRPARKVVRIRRAASAPRLLDENDVDDMLDVFAMQDAEVVRVDVNVAEAKAPKPPPRSGFMRKVAPPLFVKDEDEIEELTEGIEEGWEDDIGA